MLSTVDLLASDRPVTRLLRVAGVLALGLAGWFASLPAHALVEMTGITKIAAGDYHTCALTTAGGVKCWGSNPWGQLGDNTRSDRSTPVDVSGLASGVAAIAVGGQHTCALTTAGGVKCWGYNGYGQLGDNYTFYRLTPADVVGLESGIDAITASWGYACALTTAGGVKCWGNNDYGALGDNSTTDRYTPVDVSGLSTGVTAITSGDNHTCALTTAGGVRCWGFNAAGQLGDNTTIDRLTPIDVPNLVSGVRAVAAGGNHTCALTTAGGLKCWGYNAYGQLGDNSAGGGTAYRATPADVSGLTSGVAAIAARRGYTCAITTAGGAKCWGYNRYGQLGDNSTTNRFTPVDVSGLPSGVAVIAAGGNHTCALMTAAEVKCWGWNVYGQLGDGTAVLRTFPAPVLTVYSIGTPSGNDSSLSLLASFNIAPADVGFTGNFYVAARLATEELYFFTSNGFILYSGGPMPSYSTDTLSNRSITILSGLNVIPYFGTTLFAGYGLNEDDLISNGKYEAIYTIQ